MRRALYTIGRPEAELEAIRRLIAQKSGLDENEIYPYAFDNDFGRVYYAAIEPSAQRGLIFTISRRPSPHLAGLPQHLSEWEVKDLFKLARLLDLHQFSMLGPIRLFEDEIAKLALT